MPTSDRYRPDTPDLLRRIADMERRLSALEKNPNAGNSSVNRGAFRVIHPTGAPVASLGQVDVSGEVIYGLVLQDPDGSSAAVIGSDVDGNTQLAFYDSVGNAVIKARDTPFGLQRPALVVPWMDPRDYNSPRSRDVGIFSSSGSWTDTCWLQCHIQASAIRVGVRVSLPAGVAASVRIINLASDPQLVAGPQAFAAGAEVTHVFEFNPTRTAIQAPRYGNYARFDIQGQVTSGAGNCSAWPYFVINYGGVGT